MRTTGLGPTGCLVAAALAMAGPARAQNTGAPQAEIDRHDQQILELQREVRELKELLKANAPAAKPHETSTAQTGPKDSVAKSADSVKLSETPAGYRLIDTDTTSVGVYGLIDLTVATSSSGGPNAHSTTDGSGNGLGTQRRWAGLDVSWMNGNRWGFAGSHVLDKESKTELVFKLESEFELPTGNFDTANVIFNRDAWIGVKSPTIGLVTFGRQDTLGRDINMIWANPFSTDKNGTSEGGWMNNQVMYQLMEYSGSPTGNRWDGGLVWKKDWGNWVSFLGMQFAGLQQGGDVVYSDHRAGTQHAVGLGYNSSDGSWHASGSYTHANYDGFAKQVESLGGNFRPVNWLRLNGGVYHADIAQPDSVGNRKDNAWTVSAQIYPGGKFDYALAYYKIKANNAGIDGNGNTMQPFDLTANVTSAASGSWGTLYGAAFYRWDRQTDFYLAFDYSKVGGGYNTGYFNGKRSINQLGAGVRYFF